MKEVKAIDMMFIPRDFEVFFSNVKYLFNRVSASGVESRYITGSGYNCFSSVMVDEKKYEDEIIWLVLKIIPECEAILKSDGGIVYARTKGVLVKIGIDCRPWLEEYRIIIDN